MKRREFIRDTAIVIGGVVAAGLLQACASPVPGASASPPALSAAVPAPQRAPAQASTPQAGNQPVGTAGSPKRGGVLRQASDETPTSWDIHGSGLGEVFQIMAPVYNTLITQDISDPNGEKLAPDLAREWSVSPDALTYTFSLQQNVKWHDGAPFTSADVVFSLERMINPPQGVLSARKELFGSVASVDAADDHTIVVKLKSPDASILDVLAVGWNVIYPKHLVEQDPKKVNTPAIDGKIGTGPFRMVEYKLNQYVRYERNPDYFKSGLPYVDRMELQFIPDTTSRVTALVGGNLDMFSSQAGDLGPEEAQIVPQQKPNEVTLGRIPILSPFVLFPNLTKPPFDNVVVRQAISEAIDRKALTEALPEGGAVGTLVFPRSRWDLAPDQSAQMPGFNPNLQTRQTHARELLAKAGFTSSNPLSIELMTRPSPDSARVATILAPMIEAIGVKVTLVPETITRHAERRASGDFQITVNNLTQTGVDPTHLFGTYLLCNVPRNQSRICVPDLDKLFKDQLQQTEFDKRKPIVDQLNTGHLQQAAFDIVSWRNGLNAWWNYVKGFSQAPARFTAHARLDTVWLDR